MKDSLSRYVEAQQGVWPQALAELQAGDKRGHWMWFVFPQIAGLGRSPTARLYAIADRAEAVAYLGHELLGPRLVEASEAVLAHHGDKSAETILGGIDAMKLRSSMTLFEAAGGYAGPFGAVLDGFFGGNRDEHTLAQL